MAFWPSSVATNLELYVAVNGLLTPLNGAIDAAVTTITLTDTTGFPTSGAVVIDTEVIAYTGISGENLTGCTRGFDGTIAAIHANGVPVSLDVIADNHNILANEIIAVENWLNTGGNQGPQGATGPQGSQGSQGNQGFQGAAGTSPSLTRTVNAQSGTTYTFVLADGSNAGTSPLVTFGNAGATTVTVPPNSSVAFATGSTIDCLQIGAGKVTFSPGSGVTINSQASHLSIAAQYVAVSLIKTATNTWYLIGNLIT
jgi:hypothetical protein